MTMTNMFMESNEKSNFNKSNGGEFQNNKLRNLKYFLGASLQLNQSRGMNVL